MRTPDGLTHKQAIKLLHADLELDEDLTARARDEARLMSQLHHDHVVAVHALTRLDERWAVFMEYVNGIDAGALLSKHPQGLPPKVAVAMIERACAALDAGWNQPSPETGRPLRVVHRDLKPANLMISVEGTVKVMDFGVARADFDREAHTQSTQYGTGRYMAPERWLHIRAEHPSDVYALGVTLWELLLAQRFERMPLAPAHFDAKLEQQLSLLGPERDPHGQISALLRAMLAFDEDERPSAHQAMESLEEILEGLSGPSLRRFARSTVPPLLESRRAELLSDSQVWPHTPRSASRTPSQGVTPQSGSPSGSSTGSGPSDQTSVSQSEPTPATRPEPSSPTLAEPASPAPLPADPPPQRSILVPAVAGIALGLALVGGGVWWLSQPTGPTPQDPSPTALTEPNPASEERRPLTEAEPATLSSPGDASEEPAAEADRPEELSAPAPRRSDPPPSRSRSTPQEDPEPQVRITEAEKETVVVPKEQAPAAPEPIAVRMSADPINGSVSWKTQTAQPFGTLSLPPGPTTLTWTWDDGSQLSCRVDVSSGTKLVKFDKAMEKCL